MNTLKSRRIRHFLKLAYPLRVVAQSRTFCADYPDLPGCQVVASRLVEVYAEAEAVRRQWITERVLTDDPIPLPNSACSQGSRGDTVRISG